jgi:hypothetical protein
MKKLMLMVAIAISIASCQHPESTPPLYKTKRVVVLENNTVSFVRIPTGLDTVYRNNDTVWVNMETHKIDDTSSTTMMCVIKP